MPTKADKAMREAPFRGIQYSEVVSYYYAYKELQAVYATLSQAPEWVRRAVDGSEVELNANEMVLRMVLYLNMKEMPDDFQSE